MDNQIQENSIKPCFSVNLVDKSHQTIFLPQYQVHYAEDTLNENSFNFAKIQNEIQNIQSSPSIKRKDKKDLIRADLIWKTHFEDYQYETDLENNSTRKKVKTNFQFDTDVNTAATNEITEDDTKYMRKCIPSLLINTTKLVGLIYETHFSENSNTEPFELFTNNNSKKIKIHTKKIDNKKKTVNRTLITS